MLEVKGIDVAYGHAKVLHDVSLRIDQGEMVFIVGRNGAGKTTLLKTMAGLLAPTQGIIIHEGQPIQGRPAEKVARLGLRFVAQDKKVFAGLTVRSNIELAAHASGEPPAQALATVLALYPKMEKFLDVPAGSLSGGQREILLIGRALVGHPKVLLIDEPTEGLAAVVISDIFKILDNMKAHQVSAVIVEQNLAVVTKLADRVYIMKEGKIEREVTDPRAAADLERYL